MPAAGVLHRRRHGGAHPEGQHHALAGTQHAGSRVLPGGCRSRLRAGRVLLHHRAAVRRRLPQGRGHRPAITFLFFAPAGNVMALAYTGSILGAEFAVARFVLCLLFGIGIGLLMALLFWRDDASHDAQTDALFAEQASISPPPPGVLLSLVAVLIAGTLKLWPLPSAVATVNLPLPWAEAWQATLFQWVPFDAAKGEEGVSVQGSVLIVLAAADRLHRLEGAGEHHRRRQPLDLDRAGPHRHHLAGGRDCA